MPTFSDSEVGLELDDSQVGLALNDADVGLDQPELPNLSQLPEGVDANALNPQTISQNPLTGSPEYQDENLLSGSLGLVGDISRAGVTDLVNLSLGQSNPLNQGPAYTPPFANTRALLNAEPLPQDIALAETAKTNPKLAVAGQVGQGIAGMAPFAALGGAPAWVHRLVAAGFSLDMINHARTQFPEWAEYEQLPPDQQDPDTLAKLRAGVISTFAFAPLAGGGAVKGVGPVEELLKRGDARLSEANRKALEASRPLATIGEFPGADKLDSLKTKSAESIQAPGTEQATEKASSSELAEATTSPQPQPPVKPSEAVPVEKEGLPWEFQKGSKVQADLSTAGDYVISHREGEFNVSYRPEGQHKPLGTFPTLEAAKAAAEQHAENLKAKPGGGISEKSPQQQAQSAKNNSLQEFARVNGVEYVEGDAAETLLRKVNEKKISSPLASSGESGVSGERAPERIPATRTEKAISKEPWQQTQAERLAQAEASLRPKERENPEWVRNFLGNQKIYHRNAIKQALHEGDPVPPEVLKDYPDLQKSSPNAQQGEPASNVSSPDPTSNIDPLGKQKPGVSTKAITPEMSIVQKEEILGDEVRDRILNAPSFPKLIAAGRAAVKAIHGKVTENYDAMMRKEPWDLLSKHAGIMNANSQRAKTLRSLADAVIREANLPMMKPGKFRGQDYAIDWDKVAAQRKTTPENKPAQPSTAPAPKHPLAPVGESEASPIKSASTSSPIKEAKSKEPWEMTKQERLEEDRQLSRGHEGMVGNDPRREKLIIAGHRQLILDAIEEGKTIPEEVLKDYPDLRPIKQGETQVGDKPETQGAIGTPGAPLLPSSGGTPSLTPKSQRQIIADIAKGLKVPIRFGRLTTSKFAGYFKKIENLIGSKTANDIPIVSHETGHKLDDTFKLSADKAIQGELDILGDPSTPNSRSSWTPSKTKKYKMGEGVAEFVRYWLTDPAHAQKVAPKTLIAFEKALDANKDFGDVMRQAQEDIQVWKTSEPQARLRSQISVGDNPNGTRYTLSQLTRDVVDDLHILRLASEDAAKGLGTDLPPTSNPYLLARNLRGSYGMAETFIRNGQVDFNSKQVKLGTSLQDALKPVAGRINDFRDWIVAKRAQELQSQGRQTGLVPSDVDTVAKKFDSAPNFQKAFENIKDWNDSLLQYAVDSGLISKDSATAMRDMNQDYVPFHRLFEVGAGEAPSQASQGIGMGLNVGKPGSLKRLHGSTRNIVDPLETMVKNAYTIITASEKAAINRAVAEMADLPDMGKWVERVATPKEEVKVELERIRKQLEAAGADLTKVPDDLLMSFYKQSRRTPFGENIIRVIRDGEPEFYRLNRDLHDTFQALDLEDSGRLVRIFSAPSQLLRSGVVLEPSFNIANALRDTFSAAVISKYGALPFETTLKGMAAMLGNKKMVAEWAASGGKNSVEANFFDRKKLQSFLRERITKDLTPAEQALVIAKSPIAALRWLTGTFEEATRIGEYKIALEKLKSSGMPEGEARRLAAFEARDRQDFAKGGAKTKIVRHMAAFWNAGLQANVKLAQAFRHRPVRTILQGLAFITIPKMIEQALNWDDEDYWNRKQWERDLFFLIPIGKDSSNHTRFLRIPTPFEPGLIFGTFPGRVMQWAKKHDSDAMKGFPSLFVKQSVPNPMPQWALTLFEDFFSGKQGWDVWRGRNIVPDRLADLPPEHQWTEQTSGAAKRLGKAIGYSPMKIDHIIERNTGGMGKLLTGRQVPGQRFVTAPLNVSNQPAEDFYDILSKLRAEKEGAKLGQRPFYKATTLTELEKVAEQLSELRKNARNTPHEGLKRAYQEQAFQIEKQAVEQYKRLNP